ncbi:MAG: PilW family protein [Pseudomonadota bacterium]
MTRTPKGNVNIAARGVRGLSLIEIMVALFIGTFLLTGALSIYANGYGTIQVTARVARMQESSRYAMELLEPDIRAAGYWGATTDTESIDGRATPADTVDIAIDNDCENNWAVHLERPIEGADGANPYNATCLIGSNRYIAGSDMLIVRHVADTATATADLQAGTLYMRADENRGELFVGTTEPAGYAPTAGNFALIVHAYYVSPTSDFDPALPSLRRLTLESGANPTVADEEVLAGAEDLQVQFGIDTDADGSVNSYVDADPALDYSQVMSVRVWLRMRTDQDEDAFVDNATYTYADVSFSPSNTADPDDDRLRRILTSKTVALRNRVVELNGGAL